MTVSEARREQNRVHQQKLRDKRKADGLVMFRKPVTEEQARKLEGFARLLEAGTATPAHGPGQQNKP